MYLFDDNRELNLGHVLLYVSGQRLDIDGLPHCSRHSADIISWGGAGE